MGSPRPTPRSPPRAAHPQAGTSTGRGASRSPGSSRSEPAGPGPDLRAPAEHAGRSDHHRPANPASTGRSSDPEQVADLPHHQVQEPRRQADTLTTGAREGTTWTTFGPASTSGSAT